MKNYLSCDNSLTAGVMHENFQYLGYNLWQVNLELCPQGSHNVLNQQYNRVLHCTVWCPKLLKTKCPYAYEWYLLTLQHKLF